MKIDSIDIEKTLNEAQALMEKTSEFPPALKSMMSLLVVIIRLLVNQRGLDSHNSRKPPSSDPNRTRKKPSKKISTKKPGGQPDHTGETLKQIETPDEIEVITIDRRTLPKGTYEEVGFEKRQVFDIDISRIVTEYQAQILRDASGRQFVAPFPKGVRKAVQYGNTLKAPAVYLSQYQLIPYQRVHAYFSEQTHIPISQGRLFRFNQDAYQRLATFDAAAKDKLASAALAHADETGINIGGKKYW